MRHCHADRDRSGEHWKRSDHIVRALQLRRHAPQHQHSATVSAGMARPGGSHRSAGTGRGRCDAPADARDRVIVRGRAARSADADEVLPGLLLGSQPSRRGAKWLLRAGLTHVVDLRVDTGGSPSWPSSVTVIRHPLAEYEAPTADALDSIGATVAQLLGEDAVVLVHCREGIQRGPLVVCAALLHLGWPLSDAARLVRARRRLAAMSEAQLEVLRVVATRVKAATRSP